MNTEVKLLLYLAAFIVGNFLVFSFLGAMLCRESVKQDLSRRVCAPLRIWWIPCGTFFFVGWGTWFHVLYRDVEGLLHKARCYVRTPAMASPLGPRYVRWMKDKIVDAIDI